MHLGLFVYYNTFSSEDADVKFYLTCSLFPPLALMYAALLCERYL